MGCSRSESISWETIFEPETYEGILVWLWYDRQEEDL